MVSTSARICYITNCMDWIPARVNSRIYMFLNGGGLLMFTSDPSLKYFHLCQSLRLHIHHHHPSLSLSYHCVCLFIRVVPLWLPHPSHAFHLSYLQNSGHVDCDVQYAELDTAALASSPSPRNSGHTADLVEYATIQPSSH